MAWSVTYLPPAPPPSPAAYQTNREEGCATREAVNANVAAAILRSTRLPPINAESVDSVPAEGAVPLPSHGVPLTGQRRSRRQEATLTSELSIGSERGHMLSLDGHSNTHAYSARHGTMSRDSLIDAQLSLEGANAPPPLPSGSTPGSHNSELGSDRFVAGEGFDMSTQDTIASEECIDLSNEFDEFDARSPSQHEDEEFLPMDGLEGFCLPESMVAPDNYMGLALILVAGGEIRKELGCSRSLMSAPAQLRQECIDSLCTPTERLLTEAEARLRAAYRRNLTPSEISYVNHRFYEFVADYHFAVTMHEFLFGSWPLEPRKEMPGEAALASSYVLRILSGRNRCPRGEVTKQSLVQFQHEHIVFRRQLQVDKRRLLADLLTPSTFMSSHASRLSSHAAYYREP
ncbi:hypothetical protein ACSSS7_002527 [Eimeria intestinalis]